MPDKGTTNDENETPWPEGQGFFLATRLRRISYASLRASFIPRFKAWGFLTGFIRLTTPTPPLPPQRGRVRGGLFPC